MPSTYVVNFQLAGGVWILQTLPAVFLGLVWGWVDRGATLAGWVVGTAVGTYLLIDSSFNSSTYRLDLPGLHGSLYIGLIALALNLVVVLAGSALRDARTRRQRRSGVVESYS